MGTVWRQLWSHGLAEPSEGTTAAVLEKACPKGWPTLIYLHVNTWMIVSLQSFCPRVPPHGLPAVFDEGGAVDALGWSQILFCSLLLHPVEGNTMRRVMQHLVSRTWPDMVIDYYNLQRLIPLKKPNGQGIRPVCIPTVWRKVIALCCLDKWKSSITSAAGDFQFACGRAFGTLAYATAIQRHLVDHEHHMCIQLDLKDAFNGIDRRAAFRIMCECDPAWAASQASWIGHADWLSGPESPDYNFLTPVKQGVP